MASTPTSYTVMGYMEEAAYQQCAEAATYCSKNHSDEFNITMKDMLGFEYEKQRAALVEHGKLEDAEARVIVINEATGKAVPAAEFLELVCKETSFKLFDLADSDPESYLSLARAHHSKFLRSSGCKFVWMVIRIGDMVQGRIMMQLYSTLVPRTCQNFIHLCRGDLPDVTGEDGKPFKLHYKNSTFYRTVRNGWIQGGDISGKGGNGGHSAYGRYFPDENFAVKHDSIGIVGMVNDGEHTNSSSFYITLQKCQWMDTRYVAFGRVVEGLSVVQAIAAVPTKHNQTPTKPVVISDCGEVEI